MAAHAPRRHHRVRSAVARGRAYGRSVRFRAVTPAPGEQENRDDSHDDQSAEHGQMQGERALHATKRVKSDVVERDRLERAFQRGRRRWALYASVRS